MEVPVPEMELEPEPVTAAQVLLSGELKNVSPQQIQQLVERMGRAGMLALDSEQLRVALETLPWVYRAQVRKVWPDRIALTIEEQRPTVRWGDDGYLNLSGVYFAADGVESANMLMIRSTQEDTVVVYQQLQALSQILGRQLYGRIIEMVVDRRGAVTLYLEQGVALHLGRRAIERRLKRWVDQAERIKRQYPDQLIGVDLRYGQGMVLQLKEGREIAPDALGDPL